MRAGTRLLPDTTTSCRLTGVAMCSSLSLVSEWTRRGSSRFLSGRWWSTITRPHTAVSIWLVPMLQERSPPVPSWSMGTSHRCCRPFEGEAAASLFQAVPLDSRIRLRAAGKTAKPPNEFEPNNRTIFSQITEKYFAKPPKNDMLYHVNG